MEHFVTNIADFWSNHLASHEYVSKTPFRGMRDNWHENFHSDGYLLQTFNDDIPIPVSVFYNVLGVAQGTVAWTCLIPNTILPPHYDKFYLLAKNNGYAREECVRYQIFLEDSVFGQLVVLGNTVISDWKKGDVWMFDSETHHYAVNASNVNFHSCQVSTKNNEISAK